MITKNILYLRTDLGTKDLIGGGSVAHTLGVIKGLLHQGHQIHCASSAMHGVLKKIDNAAFSLLPLVMSRLLKPLGFKINCLISNIFFYYRVSTLCKEQKIDLLYQRYSMLNVVGVWLKQQHNIPFILEYNGSETWVDANWSSRKLHMTKLIDNIEMYNLQQADTIIVVSQVLKQQLVARGIAASKIRVNPNGVDIEQFNAARLVDERANRRRELNLEDRYVIGFSGTFSYWHGVELLAYLIPKVLKHQERVHFLLMGDGKLKAQLAHDLFEHMCSGVTFTGMLAADEMPSYLAACDAFICPTQPNKDGTAFFGSPTKLFEYMAIGKPIIASRVDQIADILDEHKELLIDPHDYEGFVQVTLKLVDMHHEQYHEICNALQKKVQQYSWHAHVERILSELADAS